MRVMILRAKYGKRGVGVFRKHDSKNNNYNNYNNYNNDVKEREGSVEVA